YDVQNETKWVCDPEDPRYHECFARFIREAARRYDGHPDLECIDIAIVGFWGEGEGTGLLSQPTREALMDAYLDSFHKTRMVAQLTDPATLHYTRAKRPDVGYRFDCLGDMRGFSPNWCHMYDLYPQLIVDCGVKDAWEQAIVSLEACWWTSTWIERGWDVDYIIEKSLQWHMSTYNGKSAAIPVAYKDKMDDWQRKMGYRFQPRKFSYTAKVAPGGQLCYDSWWENAGVAPVYYPYPVALRLVGEGGTFLLKTDIDLMRCLPGDSLFNGQVTLPETVPAGRYQLQIGVLSRFEDKPAIELAIEGRTQQGYYPLGPITVE
nr:DUF4832 domain-containing protein [bacterium]